MGEEWEGVHVTIPFYQICNVPFELCDRFDIPCERYDVTIGFPSHFLVRTPILNCIKIRSVLLEVMQASRLTRPPYHAFILCTVSTKCVKLEHEVTP
jgi:hypothetical protein